MSIKVNDNWGQHLFDGIYLITDIRSVGDEQLTCREVDCLEEILGPDKSTPVLDLCGGQGRHSLELSRRGFRKVTVLDYSRYLVELGEKRAKKEKLNTVFVPGDARNTGLPGQSFRFVIIMGSSFGYFMNEDENKKIMEEAFRLLAPGGTLLLDLPDRDYVLQNFKPFSRHEVNEDVTVIRERELGEDVIYSRETVTSRKEGCLRERTYCIRLYHSEKISGLMTAAGFSSVTCRKNFMSRGGEGDYGFLTNRMIVIARKGQRVK